MTTVQPPRPATTTRRTPLLDALRRHALLVLVCALVGLGLGWYVGQGQQPTWSSTARVLINPAVGNPFAPAPSSVRQDELTSLETEAQVAASAEVLAAVAAANPPVTVSQIQRGLLITVPTNTQILTLTFTAGDAETAERVTDSLATLYLDNRDQRASRVNSARVERVEKQTEVVVDDLRAATAAAQRGTAADRQFQSELAAALRNQLVSLRAQRSFLENSEVPAGSVISPASAAARSGGLVLPVMVAAGALVGLALGWVVALLRERLAGRVRTPRDVLAAGLPVLVASTRRRWRPFRAHASEPAGDIARRLRAEVLQRTPAPEVVAVAPAATGEPAPAVAAALADSFARAGHRVILVGGQAEGDDERGLAHALLHERTRVAELLRPSADPLLKLLPWGLNEQNRDRLSHRRLRTALAPLVDAGHVVVLESPDVTSVEGEAILGAADLGVVVVTTGRTHTRAVTEVGRRRESLRTEVVAAVLDEQTATWHPDLGGDDDEDGATESGSVKGRGASDQVARSPR